MAPGGSFRCAAAPAAMGNAQGVHSVEEQRHLTARFLTEARAKFSAKFKKPTPSTSVAGDYRVVKTLGTGSFGRVVLAEFKKEPGSFVALKVLEKARVVRLKQVQHTLDEKHILAAVEFPFLVNLTDSFKDNANLYMSLEFAVGGELFSHLRREVKFKEPRTKFYAAQIVLALEYLQSLNILYRDLKPENLLFDRQGYIKITDFGFAKYVEDKTFTLCGTPEYLAPGKRWGL